MIKCHVNDRVSILVQTGGESEAHLDETWAQLGSKRMLLMPDLLDHTWLLDRLARTWTSLDLPRTRAQHQDSSQSLVTNHSYWARSLTQILPPGPQMSLYA